MRHAISIALIGLGPLLSGCIAHGAEEAGRYRPLTAGSDMAYQLPTGGPDTISIAIIDCAETCLPVAVMIDPDDYWQRTSEHGAYSGIAPEGLYAAVKTSFEAQGFDDMDSVLDITKDNPVACPQYLERGRIWLVRLGRGASSQRINYDSACVGSLDARRAQKATDALADLSDLTHILDGTVTVEDAMDDEE